jgi:hypothetical protein
LWYGPKTFFPRWQKITGATTEYVGKNFGTSMLLNLVSALLASYILAHFISYTMLATGTSGVSAGVITAFWVWLGFCFTTLLAASGLDPRDKFLLVIQGGDRLVTLLLMGVILGAFMN